MLGMLVGHLKPTLTNIQALLAIVAEISAKPMMTGSRSSDLQFCPQPDLCSQQPHRWMKAKKVETDEHRQFGIDSKAQRLAFRLQDFMPPFCCHATAAEKRSHCWVATYRCSSNPYLKSHMQSPANVHQPNCLVTLNFCSGEAEFSTRDAIPSL